MILVTTSPDRNRLSVNSPRASRFAGGPQRSLKLLYPLVAAHGFIEMGHQCLVIGAETLSRMTDYTDRTTCILFADGAGAALVEKADGPGDLHGWHVDSNGALEEALFCEFDGKIEMAGQAIFKNAVLAMENAALKSLAMAGISADDIDLVVPHQANVRIVEAHAPGIPYEKTSMVTTEPATSSAPIPGV